MNEKEVQAGLAATPGYRYAKCVGSELHVAGQVPNNADGEIVGADPYVQAKACLANLGVLLRCHGFAEEDIQRLTIYVVGSQELLADAWRAVREHFSDQVPPATLLGVCALGYENQLVEIDATVVRAAGGCQ